MKDWLFYWFLRLYYRDLAGMTYWSIVEDSWLDYIVIGPSKTGKDLWTVQPSHRQATFYGFRGHHIRTELWNEDRNREIHVQKWKDKNLNV